MIEKKKEEKVFRHLMMFARRESLCNRRFR